MGRCRQTGQDGTFGPLQRERLQRRLECELPVGGRVDLRDAVLGVVEVPVG